MHGKLKIFSGRAGLPLAQNICRQLSVKLGQADIKPFADGEIRPRLLEDVRETDVFIVNPTHMPESNFFDLCLLGRTAHDSSANRVTLVIPYLGYNRQDRRDRPRVTISSAFVADMLINSFADRLLLLDVHNEATLGSFEKKGLRVDHLYSSSVSVQYLKKIMSKNFVVASPDVGGGARARAYAHRLNQNGHVVFDKSRTEPNQIKEKSIRIIGNVRDKDVVFVDDLIDTGGSLIADAKAAKKKGAKKIFAFATHGLFSGQAIARLDDSAITEVIVTDSIYHSSEELKSRRVKITVLSVASLLADAIRRIHEGESISELFI